MAVGNTTAQGSVTEVDSFEVLRSHLENKGNSYIRLNEGQLEVVHLPKGDSRLRAIYTEVVVQDTITARCLPGEKDNLRVVLAKEFSTDNDDSGFRGVDASDDDTVSEGSSSSQEVTHRGADEYIESEYEFIDRDVVRDADEDIEGEYESIDRDAVVSGFVSTLTVREVRDSLLRIDGLEGGEDQLIRETLTALNRFSSRPTKSNFKELELKLRILPDVVKRHISDNRLLMKVLGDNCLAKCNERFPLFILETALDPSPQKFKNFLTRLVNDDSRNNQIDYLKKNILANVNPNVQISPADKYMSEKILGYALPDITYGKLAEVLNYIQYASDQGLREEMEELIRQAGGSRGLEREKGLQLARLSHGFNKEFVVNAIESNMVEAGNTAQYIRKLDKGFSRDFIEDARANYPISFDGGETSLKCFDAEGDVERLKGKVNEFADSLKLELEGDKKESLQRALRFLCTQVAFAPVVSYLTGNYTNGAADVQKSLEDLKYEQDRSLKFIPLEAPLRGFKVEVSLTYVHQISLDDESLRGSSFVTNADLQRTRGELGVVPNGATLVTGSFDVIIDPDNIGDEANFQRAFQMVNFQARHEHGNLA